MEKPGQEWEDYKGSLNEIGVLGEQVQKEQIKADSVEKYSLGETREISDPDLKRAVDLFFSQYPELEKHLIIDIGDSNIDVSLKNRPALFGPEAKRFYKPRIAFNVQIENVEELLQWLGTAYPDKVKEIESKLREAVGDNFNGLTGKILKLQILTHELGHAKFYFDKYKPDDSITYTEAFERRRLDYNTMYNSLPVPGVLSGAAIDFWKRSVGSKIEDKIVEMIKLIKEEYFANNGPRRGMVFDESLFRENLTKYGVFNDSNKMDNMFVDQRKKEEEFSVEKQADQFAVEFLKQHWEELDLGKE